MFCANAIKFHRKSGGAQPRDLRFNGPLLEMLGERGAPVDSLRRCYDTDSLRD
jgi:hypothetical protein